MEKLTEDLSSLDGEALAAELTAREARAAELAEIDADALTDEQLDELETRNAEVEQIEAETANRAAAAAERAERVAAAKAKAPKPAASDEDEAEAKADETPADEADNDDEEPLDVEIPDDASELVEEQEKEAVVAAGPKQVVKKTAGAVARPEVDETVAEKPFSIVAAADVRGFAAGQELTSMADVAKAWQSRVSAFRAGSGSQSIRSAYPVFAIQKNTPAERTISENATKDEALEVLTAAADAYRADPTEVLTASGGWAAPSEIRYDLPIIEAAPSGLLSLPSVQVNRGGFQFTKGIDFSVIYNDADVFFEQTEAQAEAQTVKPFLEISEPVFEEARLEAIGAGIRAGILTNHAWPELIQRFVSGSATAFAHKKNNKIISKVVGDLIAVNAAKFGSSMTDALAAIELHAVQLRYKWRLAENQVFDGIAPVWVKSVFREDLSRRQGVDVLAITDAQITSWLQSRGIRLQYVYDWTGQDLDGGVGDYPATAKIGLWLPGTYVLGGSPVISFDALYDYDGISKNTYTVSFMEESILVAKVLPTTGRLITIDTAPAARLGKVGPRGLAVAV